LCGGPSQTHDALVQPCPRGLRVEGGPAHRRGSHLRARRLSSYPHLYADLPGVARPGSGHHGRAHPGGRGSKRGNRRLRALRGTRPLSHERGLERLWCDRSRWSSHAARSTRSLSAPRALKAATRSPESTLRKWSRSASSSSRYPGGKRGSIAPRYIRPSNSRGVDCALKHIPEERCPISLCEVPAFESDGPELCAHLLRAPYRVDFGHANFRERSF
jgi:hypothetical protein